MTDLGGIVRGEQGCEQSKHGRAASLAERAVRSIDKASHGLHSIGIAGPVLASALGTAIYAGLTHVDKGLGEMYVAGRNGFIASLLYGTITFKLCEQFATRIRGKRMAYFLGIGAPIALSFSVGYLIHREGHSQRPYAAIAGPLAVNLCTTAYFVRYYRGRKETMQREQAQRAAATQGS